MQTLREQAVQPVFGEALTELTQEQWDQLKSTLSQCQAWLAACPATPLGSLPESEVQALLASGAEADLLALLDQDEAEKEHSEQAMALEKLIRLQRDLLELLNNFVSFSRFYRREGAAFQAGTLFLDGRSCDLTVEVTDAAAHSALAAMAKTYLAYCECKREGEKKTIVAAFTAGDVDFLFVGRNGVFYDREGNDWDATIVKLIDNPTSIGQAFFSPYKKFLRMIEEQVAKHAAAKNDLVNTNLGDSAAKLTTAPKELAPAAAPRKTDVGTVAAIGVALGSLSAVIVGIFGKFIELGPWIPMAILGIVLAISGPSMMIAWLAAPAQPGADSGCQRLGHQRPHEHQSGPGPQSVADGQGAAECQAQPGRPVCRLAQAAQQPVAAGRRGAGAAAGLALALAGYRAARQVAAQACSHGRRSHSAASASFACQPRGGWRSSSVR